MEKYEYSDFAQFPALVRERGSLSPMEKALIGHLILMLRPRVIIELGVFEAVTTDFICEFLQLNLIDACVYSFDLPHVVARLRESNPQVQKYETQGVLQLVPGHLPDSLINWFDEQPESFDLAIVDAQHTYLSVKKELELLWSHLSSGGYIICDDYLPKFRGIQYAIHEFARRSDVCFIPISAQPVTQDEHKAAIALLTRNPSNFALREHLNFFAENLLQWSFVKYLWQKILRPLVKR